MGITIVFRQSAFKHGVSEADIRRAFKIPEYDAVFEEGDPSKNLLIGFDRNANPKASLPEILYNVIDENTVQVFHAMKCRAALIPLLK
ncbi:MAG: hypothetical protein LBK77_02075 [Spirochaetaceae bacterium]|jgi:hypothetical protein|nr:hypothetical protein [Spirochaetaceae bacterium]